MKRLHILVITCLFLTTSGIQARTWTNKKGASFTGELKSVDRSRKVAKIQRDDGKMFEVEFADLIPQDVTFIENYTPPPKGVVLADDWKTAISKGEVAAGDLAHVLKLGEVEANDDLTPDKSITIYGGIKYLESLDQALERLKANYGNVTPLTNNTVGTSGFPSESISYHAFKGNFDGFGHLILVTDRDEQTVAVQLLNNTPKRRLLSGHSNKWSVFNFVQNRRKGSSSYAIAYEVEAVGRMLRIDSELVDKTRTSREWVRLYLPKKFAQIIKYTIINSG